MEKQKWEFFAMMTEATTASLKVIRDAWQCAENAYEDGMIAQGEAIQFAVSSLSRRDYEYKQV